MAENTERAALDRGRQALPDRLLPSARVRLAQALG